jgi:hypothetical protein
MSVKQSSTSSPDIPCLLWRDRQVAAAIGMSVKRIQELARLGLLPGFKVGRNWQFDPEALRSWIKRNGASRRASEHAGAARVKKHGQLSVYRHSRKRS